MAVPTQARHPRVWRFCARIAVVVCLVVFGLGDAIERGLAGHVGLDQALAYAVSAEHRVVVSADHSGTHVDAGAHSDVDFGGQAASHGCHGCAALAQPMLQAAAAPLVLGASLDWASVPSSAGREPLVDLPPPRA